MLYCSDFGERRTRYYTLIVQTAIPLHWCVSSCGVAQVYNNKFKKNKINNNNNNNNNNSNNNNNNDDDDDDDDDDNYNLTDN